MAIPYEFNPLGITNDLPIEGVKGVFFYKNSTITVKGMKLANKTIGTAQTEDTMKVFSAGEASSIIVSNGGIFYISGGGYGYMLTLSSGGIGYVESYGRASMRICF